METASYVRERLEEYRDIVLSDHAERRAELRGIPPDSVISAVSDGDIVDARDNENPNVDIPYQESYVVLVASPDGKLFSLPVYFREESVLIATVLKHSETDTELMKW